MRVYIIGCMGNMASRYISILESLGHTWTGTDAGSDFVAPAINADAVIVATPTATHVDILKALKDCGKPILCEKPLSKDLDALGSVLADLQVAKTRLQMVSQYDYLIDDDFEGETVYDYFKSGADGLYWDCINVVKHARGKVRLANKSPVWTCQINGQKLNLGLMDRAYVEMIAGWLKRPSMPTDFDGIWTAHKKVHDLEAKAKWRLS